VTGIQKLFDDIATCESSLERVSNESNCLHDCPRRASWSSHHDRCLGGALRIVPPPHGWDARQFGPARAAAPQATNLCRPEGKSRSRQGARLGAASGGGGGAPAGDPSVGDETRTCSLASSYSMTRACARAFGSKNARPVRAKSQFPAEEGAQSDRAARLPLPELSYDRPTAFGVWKRTRNLRHQASYCLPGGSSATLTSSPEGSEPWHLTCS
jgi:hypothetical protein